MKKIYGYARVSTREQNLDRQIKALLERGVDERDIVTDKASGKSLEREGYQMLKSRMLRDGDVLVIKSLDRLSRNKTHIKQELEYFKNHHIRVMVIDLPTTLIELPEGQGSAWYLVKFQSGKKEPITSHNSTYQTGDSGESMFQSIIKSSPLMDDVG